MANLKCNIITLNVRGIRNRVKRRSIFSYLKDQNCHFYLLQETFSEPKDEHVWKNEWGGDVFFSHGSNHAKGVCILVNPSIVVNVENSYKDIDGRIIAIDVICNGVNLSICNVYAPTSCQFQGKFLQILNEFMTSNLNITQLIIGGDWNATLECIDKRGGTRWKPTAYRNGIISVMEELDLIDIFRKLKPHIKRFSYESKFLKVKSRLDYFLIAKHLTQHVHNVKTKTATTPDHKAIKLSLKLSQVIRGPGLWKFNNSLLKDKNYLTLITESYPIISEKYANIVDKRLRWELIKMEIRSITISFAARKAKEFRKQESYLQKRLDVIDKSISNSCDNQNIEDKLKEFDKLKNEFNRLYEIKGKGAIFRSKARWVEYGEKPTKYFFNMEKKSYNKKVISELKRSDGKTVVNEQEIMTAIQTFYENLYSSDIDHRSNNVFYDFGRNLQFAKLSDEEMLDLDGEITLEECETILNTFQNGKSPGDDGYTAEFYKQFFSLLGQDLVNSFNAAFDIGEMSVSQRRGVITLLPKEDSNLSLLSNWRPITLLNTDYKIASKVIAKRIERVLPSIIHPDQTGFMKGRYIGQNIRLINDIIQQTELQKIPGILLFLDFQKAFDTLEWSFIQHTLNLFNFGNSIKKWISAFYTNSESSVLNNGFCTNYFKLSRGVRQRCPLSPCLFILAAEVLATRIRQDKTIRGITIFGTESKISQFADDTSAFCDNVSSVQNLIRTVNDFGIFSGLKLNTSKTKAIWLGPWRDREDQPLNLNWTKEPLRTLGIFVSYDEIANEKRNFMLKVQKLNTNLDIWRSRKLSLFGRVLITKSLGIPHLIYSKSMLVTPSEVVSSVTTSLFDFIWCKKPDKIKRQVMYQDYVDGGLRVPNMEVMAKSLKLAWISRFLSTDVLSRKENWKAIPYHFFREYGGLNFLLRCNYDKKFFNQIDFPPFYQQILWYFLELKTLYESDIGQEMILFNNKEILVSNRPFFLKDWFDLGIVSIQDILRDNGKFLSFQEFQQIYKIKCNFLNYYQVVSAIPKHLLERAKQTQLNKTLFLDSENFQLSPSLSINLTKMKNKDYYWLFVKKNTPLVTTLSKWERDLSSNDILWKNYFKQIKFMCKENKLKEFYFKLVHRILVSKKELHLFGVSNNSNCTYCGQPDSISHTFVGCHHSKTFFQNVLQHFNVENATSFTLSDKELLFGKSFNTIDQLQRSPLLKKLNYCMLLAKYYLYNQKLNQIEPEVNEFKNRLNFQYRVEKLV